MTRYFVDASNSYIGAFDGDDALARVPSGAVEVPAPPEHADLEVWNPVAGAWQDRPDRADREADADFAPAFEEGRTARLLFDISLDQENRLRALEGRAAVTRAQYRGALVARLKGL
ncbi:MAG: hypothetical protein ACE5H8_02195 [Alphaproteobacteria bacterium]